MKFRAASLFVLVATLSWGDSIAQALASHRFPDVVKLSDDLLKSHPQDPALWTARGVAFEAMGADAKGLSSFERALVAAPDFVPALKGAVEVAYRIHDPGTAAFLKRLLRLQPANQVAHAMAGVLAFEAKNYGAAATHFEKAGAALGGNEGASAQYGASLMALDRAAEAVPLFRKLLAEFPDSSNMRFDLGYAQLLAGHAMEAVETLGRFGAETASGIDGLNLLASSEAAAGHLDRAVEYFEKAMKIAPTDEQSYVNLSALLVQNDTLEQAAAVVEAGLQGSPRSARLHSLRGVVRAQLGTFDEAAAEFEVANRLDPNNAYGATGLGVLYTEANQTNRAVAVLRKRLEQAPKDSTLNYLFADALIREGAERGTPNFTEAQRALTTAVRARPDFAKAHTLLGKIYSRVRDDSKAIDELKLGVIYDPSDRTALSQLAIALRHSGRNDEAQTAIAKLKALVLRESQPENRQRMSAAFNRVSSQ